MAIVQLRYPKRSQDEMRNICVSRSGLTLPQLVLQDIDMIVRELRDFNHVNSLSPIQAGEACLYSNAIDESYEHEVADALREWADWLESQE